ncbi:MAG: hypothetical protein WEB04_03865 [Dehalococcoidia bacterium]
MTREADKDVLDVLACEFELRPLGAPGIDAVAKAALNVKRDGERKLAVSFDPSAQRVVEAFAAAERDCCSTLSWTVETQNGTLRLIVGAQPQQIDVLEAMFTIS